MGADLREFYSALKSWADEAVAQLRMSSDAVWAVDADEDWQYAGGDTYCVQPRTHTRWSFAGLDRVQELDSYVRARAVGSHCPPIAAVLDKLVGSALGQSRVEFWRLAASVLPAPEELDDYGPRFFDRRFEHLAYTLEASQVHLHSIHFLDGLVLDRGVIELAPGLTLERATPEEVIRGLKLGMLRPEFPSVSTSTFNLAERQASVLKRRWTLPRVVFDPISDEREPHRDLPEWDEREKEGRAVLDAIAVLTGKRVSVVGFVTFKDPAATSLLDDGWSPLRIYPSVVGVTEVKGSPELTQNLRRTYTMIRHPAFARNKALALAVRRLGLAAHRDLPEDRLLDVFIAAEAFYLSDADNLELGYRLALRAALWGTDGALDWSRQQIFDHMKRGYGLRSKYAHGTEPKPKDLKLQDRQVSLAEFVAVTEEIVRAAVLKAMRVMEESNGQLTIDWEALVLPNH